MTCLALAHGGQLQHRREKDHAPSTVRAATIMPRQCTNSAACLAILAAASASAGLVAPASAAAAPPRFLGLQVVCPATCGGKHHNCGRQQAFCSKRGLHLVAVGADAAVAVATVLPADTDKDLVLSHVASFASAESAAGVRVHTASTLLLPFGVLLTCSPICTLGGDPGSLVHRRYRTYTAVDTTAAVYYAVLQPVRETTDNASAVGPPRLFRLPTQGRRRAR